VRQQVYGWHAAGDSTAAARQLCLNVSQLSGRNDWRGRSYSWGYLSAGAAYSHTMLPNEKSCYSFEGDWFGSTSLAANSNHPGGVNVGVADGSIRFIRQNVDPDVWWAIGTRAGDEKFELLK
jgi:hypothetical protein